MKSKLNTKWLSSAEDKESTESLVRGSSTILYLLRDIVEKELTTLERNVSVEQYESPNWAHIQAHKNGTQAALQNILRLTDHLKEK